MGESFELLRRVEEMRKKSVSAFGRETKEGYYILPNNKNFRPEN